jgi:hypothetical protein
MNGELPGVDPSSPMAEGLRLAEIEMATGRLAVTGGNEGRARVCARRAVGMFLQQIAGSLPVDYGTHAMANLRAVSGNEALPEEIRLAAERLLGGSRSILASEPYSTDPLADAAAIIRYFVMKG